MEIPFQGELNVSTMRRMAWTAIRPTRGRLIAIAVFVILALWGLIGVPLTQGGTLADLWPAFQVLIPFVLFAALFSYLIFVWGPKKQLASTKLLQGWMTGVVTEEGIHLESPYTKSDLPWGVFAKTKIVKDIVLLYHSSMGPICNPFPRELFASEADWEAFVNLVRQRAPLPTTRELMKGRLWITFLVWVVIFIIVIFVWNIFQSGS